MTFTNEHPLSSGTVKPASKGGRFIAHGIGPATFAPMPKPLPTSQPPVEVKPVKPRRTPEEKRLAGLAKTAENNARQALNKRPRIEPPSPVRSMCTLCGEWFPANGERKWHEAQCARESAD